MGGRARCSRGGSWTARAGAVGDEPPFRAAVPGCGAPMAATAKQETTDPKEVTKNAKGTILNPWTCLAVKNEKYAKECTDVSSTTNARKSMTKPRRSAASKAAAVHGTR